MPKFSVSVEVDKPIQHCWDIFMDESRMAEWAIGFKMVPQMKKRQFQQLENLKAVIEAS